MRHLDLFAGIGGFSLAAHQMGWETIAAVEWDEYCQKLLKLRFPKTRIYGDIREFNGTEYRGAVDIITGGFPCQDISLSGKGEGIKGARSGLWGEMWRVIWEVRPGFVIIENSPALLFRGFEQVLCDLSKIGYMCEWDVLSASEFGVNHQRKRLYAVAYPNGYGFQGVLQRLEKRGCILPKTSDKIKLYTLPKSFEQLGDYKRIRKYDGIPDQSHRIKGLGNSVYVPLVHQIFKAIEICSE